MRRSWLILPALCLLMVSTALADRGSIPFSMDVLIYEPVQRAMIAWNGQEEILLLSTDLYASEQTRVLEVLPLPAEPKVKEGDVETFSRANNLILQKLMAGDNQRNGESTKGPRSGAIPAGEITFHEKIGAHDISVVKVVDTKGFVAWVEDYLNKQGVSRPKIAPILKESITEYIRDGYLWFVFDVVELEKKPRTNQAIQYRFASASLYYPLRISRTDQGDTLVRMLILTPQLLNRFTGIPSGRVFLPHPPVAITAQELMTLNPEMAEILGKRDGMKLRVWEIRGKLTSFDQDLLAQ
jgi:hypothetical protein